MWRHYIVKLWPRSYSIQNQATSTGADGLLTPEFVERGQGHFDREIDILVRHKTRERRDSIISTNLLTSIVTQSRQEDTKRMTFKTETTYLFLIHSNKAFKIEFHSNER